MLPDLFFTINNWITIGFAIISIILCLLIIVIISTHRKCHNCTNLLTCNTCVAVALYFIFRLVELIYGLREDWQYHQPACVFRAYCVVSLLAAFCYSFSIQAISRLFYAVFYKHKFLLTLRTHCVLILINWIISAIIPIEPLLLNGLILQTESRICAVSTKTASISLYLIFIVFGIPLNLVTIIYGIIICHIHQSTRRIAPAVPSMITGTHRRGLLGPNMKRELKVMQNMSIQTTMISLGGILSLVLDIWHITRPDPPPESIYLLSFELISIFTTFMIIALFLMNNAVKNIVWGYIFRKPPANMLHPTIHQAATLVNVN